jgi:hypothetical protein
MSECSFNTLNEIRLYDITLISTIRKVSHIRLFKEFVGQ